jgi:hypothetical protein
MAAGDGTEPNPPPLPAWGPVTAPAERKERIHQRQRRTFGKRPNFA